MREVSKPTISLDDVDLSEYLDPDSLKFEATITSEFLADDMYATLYPPKPGKQPFDLVYSDWYHDFGFRRTVVFGEWSEDDEGISLPFWRVDE